VAHGLAYLHSMEIIHADLKGLNVLITSAERACIADFGLSRIVEGVDLCKITTNITNNGRGSMRWMAPELLQPSPASPSYESDVYAFACVCYEIYTGLLPFQLVKHDFAVMRDVINGKRPSRPQNATDKMWSIIERCWLTEPSDRLTTKMLLREL
ncbi:kinase-like domain-containing protein, partial [Rhodocollybia butyracea]